MAERAQLGPLGFRIAAGSAPLDWTRLDESWAAAAEHDVFDAFWMSDHLSDASRDRGGGAFETVAMAAALAHRVTGSWIGVAVFSATFRHPALLAKSATVLDNVTGGRFILGLGAGWHEGEQGSFGVPLPSPVQRFDRLESSLAVLRALFSQEARADPGVTRPDRYFPLEGATLEPGPLRSGGPPIWLGAQRPRGIELAARFADGWPMPGNRPGDVAYFKDRRAALLKALDRVARDPATFAFAGQVSCGSGPQDRREALTASRGLFAAGAQHVILAVPAAAGRDVVEAVAREVAAPLRDELANLEVGARPGLAQDHVRLDGKDAAARRHVEQVDQVGLDV